MNDYDLRTLVSDGPFYGAQPVKIQCLNPEHTDSDPSLAVFDNKAYCFGCGEFWGAFEFAAALWGVNYSEARQRVKSGELPKATVLPAPSTPSVQDLAAQVLTYHANLVYNPAAWRYLNERGLTDETIREARIGYTGRAFAIPIYGKNRELQTIRYRRDDTSPGSAFGPKYWGTAGLNGTFLYVPPLFDWETDSIDIRPVVLCEGEFDALILAQAGVRAVTLTNGVNAFREVHKLLFENAPVFLCFDGDEPGQREASRVRQMLGSQCCGSARFQEYKDVTEYALSDPEAFGIWVRFLRTESAHIPSFAV